MHEKVRAIVLWRQQVYLPPRLDEPTVGVAGIGLQLLDRLDIRSQELLFPLSVREREAACEVVTPCAGEHLIAPGQAFEALGSRGFDFGRTRIGDDIDKHRNRLARAERSNRPHRLTGQR